MASENTPLTPSVKNHTADTEGQSAGKEDSQNATFSGSVALVCSCLGCAVGTGNVWRFPRILSQSAGENGALCFLLVWLLFLLLWSIPMLLIEYGLGRYTRKGAVQSLRELLGLSATWCGAWITLVNFAIGCYYTVIIGWCIYYVFYCIAFPLPSTNYESREVFYSYAASAWPVLTQALAAVVTGCLLLKGVSSIEKGAIVMGPFLIVFLIFIFIWCLTRPFSLLGIGFMFSPDWATLADPNLWVNALSQNAFDTSAGTGLFIAYAAYMSRKDTVVKYACIFPIANNLVSLLCGMIIFSTVFAAEKTANEFVTNAEVLSVLRSAGPASTGLTFIGLPVLFGEAGGFGRFVAVVFFLALVFAGFSSNVAFVEATVRLLTDFKLNRLIAVPLTILTLFLLGLISSLSLANLTNQDETWGYALIINGLLLQGCVLKYGVSTFRESLLNELNEGKDWRVPVVWEIFIKFIVPLEGVLVLVWWLVSSLSTPPAPGEAEWYAFGPTSLITILTQWICLLLVLIGANVILMKLRPVWFTMAPWDDITESAEMKTTPEVTSSV